MQESSPFSVLIAPLDWGLGHATRCIPIIKELVNQGALVTVAASGGQKALLKQEFPLLEFLEIPGYEISYKPGIFLKWALIFKIPAILKQIKRENKWLAEVLKSRNIDAVISDNRYGLYHKNLFSVFITHQLFIQSGSPGIAGHCPMAVGRWIDRKILKWNYNFIEKFSACWVPDFESDIFLAGDLSHPPFPPRVPLKYIGILSRFKSLKFAGEKTPLLIILSGPEPQRTVFEEVLFSQLAAIKLKAVVVRGLPGGQDSIPLIREGIKIYNHLSSEALNALILSSESVITRSGYSSIMDLVQVKKSAILVPTPGQTEQEYLGLYLQDKKWMYCVSQKKFDLEKVLAEFKKEKFILPEMPASPLQIVVEDFLKKISQEANTKEYF